MSSILLMNSFVSFDHHTKINWFRLGLMGDPISISKNTNLERKREGERERERAH